VQISLLEASGIGTRAKFYEGVGAMRDTAQNHLMAMLAYVAMEEPSELTAEAIRKRRQEVLSTINPLSASEMKAWVVRGQYKEYVSEKGVDPKSETETFVAFKLQLNDARWKGVPFYLRTGKKAKQTEARIDIIFKNPTNVFYKKMGFDTGSFANYLTIWVQPREGISVRFYAKKPGLSQEILPVDMDFSYERSFNKHIDDSYEKLLLDSMRADQTLFATASGFNSTWKFITPILRHWESGKSDLFVYDSGKNGPWEANELLSRDGKVWMER
jgi:glucose-6-phosphate 1-dehydrogenase